VQEFLRPSQIKKAPVAVRVMKDGREVCNLNCKEGRDIYMGRIRTAWESQSRLCGICGLYLKISEATADHIKLRKMGGGSRDDKQENISAVHPTCNTQRGSQRSGFYDVP
jgi:hypothetical protein